MGAQRTEQRARKKKKIEQLSTYEIELSIREVKLSILEVEAAAIHSRSSRGPWRSGRLNRAKNKNSMKIEHQVGNAAHSPRQK